MDNIIDFEPINDRICKIRVRLKFYNLTMTSIHAPTEVNWIWSRKSSICP
jgi:hypothetical protein